MNILIFSDTFLPAVNGVSTSISMLIKELAVQRHKVLLICPKTDEGIPVHIKGVEIIQLPSIPAFVYPGMYLGTLSPQTMRAVRDFKPDLVHVMTPASVGLEGLGLARAMKWPVVSTFHGYFMEPEYLQVAKINFGAQYVSRFLWSFARVFSNACDAVICPTDFVKSDLKRHKFSKPLYICSNGLDIDTSMKRKKDLESFIRHWDIDPEKTALYVGRISPEKSIDELILSFGSVVKQVPDAKLLIIGDGPLLKDLAELVVKQKLSGKVIFTGQISHQDILDIGIFKAARVFVSCSQSEVQPMSMIEATTFGLPMVVYKARGAGDMVEKNGYAIKAGDKQAFANAVARILKDKKLQEKLSQHALKFAEKYRVSTATAEMVKVYSKIIEKRTQ